MDDKYVNKQQYLHQMNDYFIYGVPFMDNFATENKTFSLKLMYLNLLYFKP